MAYETTIQASFAFYANGMGSQIVATCHYPQTTQRYYYTADRWVLSKSVETRYFGLQEQSVTTNYRYNETTHFQLEQEERILSNQNSIVTDYTFPIDAPWIPSAISSTYHMDGIPVETTRTRNGLQQEKQRRYFAIQGTKVVLSANELFASDVDPVRRSTYQYDGNGNLTASQVENDLSIAYVWGYNNTLCVAKVLNATVSQVNAVIDLIALQSMDGLALRNEINKIRIALPDAQVYTYTYFPGVGLHSVTDPNGLDSFFEYDLRGRLTVAKDKDGDILRQYLYHYERD